jgi:regulator of sigma E protease
LDSTPNGGPVNPDPKPHPHDIAEPGPIDPSTGQPDRHAEVSAVKAWFRQNLVSLVITVVVVALVCYYLDPIDTLKVVIGLGFIIFIHELGHFLAAKWCNVHVKTFSIGFGPAVPFCSYKWGETTYMLGVVPLGGYVSMVGEGTGESVGDTDTEEEENDPRSFKNKSVWQRLLIISAGVVMNVLFGLVCFMAAYMHGVREEPARAGSVASGSAAWRSGIRTGDEIRKIGSRENPTFKDIPPIVMSTSQGEKVPVVFERAGPDGKPVRFEKEAEPLREEGAYFPQLGVTMQPRLVLFDLKKHKGFRPVIPGTPAARAENPAFEPGDQVVATSDPDLPGNPVTPIPDDPLRGQPDYNAYYRRMVLLADKPVVIEVRRKGQPNGAPPVAITLQPAYRSDLGVRMRMGEIIATRSGSPAERAGVLARVEGGNPARGDRIVEVRLAGPDKKQTWFVADGKRPADAKPEDVVKPLDPILLPLELDRWAAGFPEADRKALKVDLVVLREDEHTDKRQALVLDYDPSFRFDREIVSLPNSPLPVSGLGLAYWVEAVVDEVAPLGPDGKPSAAVEAGLQPNDQVIAVQLKDLDDDGTVKAGDWNDIKPHQWAKVEASVQNRPPHEIGLRVKRGDQTLEVNLKGREDKNWPVPDRGLLFDSDYKIQRANGIGDALDLGCNRTVRFIKTVYMNLGAMIFGRVSAKTMSGPLTIATVSYKIAGEDLWQFLLFLGMISVNLAVVNFLPIPVLDGGHAVFLILEKILGRPVPERIFAFAMYTGLFLILSLMVFVIVLDVRRIFFGWF